MAYPTPPGQRIAYDFDGTIGIVSRNVGGENSPIVLPQNSLTGLNSDSSRGLIIGSSVWDIRGSSTGALLPELYPMWTALLFPTPLILRGVFVGNRFAGKGERAGTPFSTGARVDAQIQTSTDTTNGVDGTWNTLITEAGPQGSEGGRLAADRITKVPGYAPPVNHLGVDEVSGDSLGQTSVVSAVFVAPNYRLNGENSTGGWRTVAGAFARNVRALRMRYPEFPISWSSFSSQNFDSMLSFLHLYGEPDTGATSRRVEFVTADGTAVKNFNWGDVHHSQTLTTTFRVKNLSTLSASSIDISMLPASPSNTPAPHTAMEFSLGGVSFSSTLSISSIAPGASSALIYVRLVVPPSGIIGSWAPKVRAEVGAWV